jgi:hypothetical protein
VRRYSGRESGFLKTASRRVGCALGGLVRAYGIFRKAVESAVNLAEAWIKSACVCSM